MIAAKYEEIYPPNANQLVYVTDKAYTKEEVLEQETEVLTLLDFDVTFPTVLRLLERYAHLAQIGLFEFCSSRYFAELTLIEVQFNKYDASLVACTCIYMAICITKKKDRAWNSFLTRHTKYEES